MFKSANAVDPSKLDFRRNRSAPATRRLLGASGRCMTECFEPLEQRQLLATIFVNDDASGSNNGTNWTNAFNSLQVALAAATSGDDIWVAGGTYTPGSNRSDTFNLKAGVDLLGGFAGTESTPGQRSGGNTTILTGSIGADGNSDNSYHVVTAAGNLGGLLFERFTISGGNADGGGDNSQGGGFFINNASNFTATLLSITFNNAINGAGVSWDGGSGTLSNSTITLNTAAGAGGGLRINAASPTLTSVTVTANTALIGGGAAWSANSAGTLNNSTISGNTANSSGGGLFLSGGDPTFSGTTIQNNEALVAGGGIYIGGTDATISATISGNSAPNGGGIAVGEAALLTLNGGTISGNTATNGGGVFAGSGTSVNFGLVNITSNTATGNGGGVFTDQITLSLSATNISSNFAGNGAGVYASGGTGHTLANATLSNNSATGNGGGLHSTAGTMAITSSTINQNTAVNGGAVYLVGNFSRTFSGSTLNSNTVTGNGGAIWASGGTLSIGSGSGITAESNTASGSGGTIYMTGGTINIANSSFARGTGTGIRTADAGNGGLAAVVNGTLNVSNSDFLRLTSSGDGGVFHVTNSTLRVFNSRFLNSLSIGQGGAIAIRSGSTSTIAGSVFSGNFAGNDGAAIHISGGTNTITNVTAVGNLTSNIVATRVFAGLSVTAEQLAATTAGRGGFMAVSGGTTTLNNSILWSNTAVLPKGAPIPPSLNQPLLVDELQVFISGGSNVTVRNSLVAAGLPARATDGGGVVQEAPIFTQTGSFDDGSGPDGRFGTTDDRFDLAQGSPAIDSGNASLLPADILDVNANSNTAEPLPIDILGRVRNRAVNVDMGAYESEAAGVTPPEPGPPVISDLLAFQINDEGNGPSDLFPLGQGFDLVAVGVRDADLDLARIDYYFDSNNNGTYDAGTDLLLGSVAYAEDGPGGGSTFDPTIDDDGLGIAFDGIPDALQGAPSNTLDNVPESFILRLTNAQVAALGAGQVRFFAVAVDAASNSSVPESLLIALGDTSPDPDYSLIIGGGAQRPIAAQIPFATRNLPEVIQLADFDGDGLADAIVTTEDAGNFVTIYYGQGDGTFTGRYDIPNIPRSEDIVVRDFNGDGRLDFATSNWRGSGTVTIGLNQGGRGAAAFPNSAVVSYAARGIRFSIDAADLDGDGDLDLITANLNTDSNTDIFLNNGNGTFSRINGPSVGNIAVGRIRLADLNNDGNSDVIYTNRTGGINIIYARADTPYVVGSVLTAGSTASVAYPQGSRSLRGLRFGDLNGDGFQDMVVSNQASNTIAVYINNGSGGFGAGTLYTVGSAPEDIAIGDLNNDNVPDLAVANTGSANMSLLTNNGDGTFQPAITIVVGAGPEGIAIGDVTNDGANDIVTANIQANTISFLKNSIARRSAVGTENGAGTAFVGIINQTSNPIIFEQDSNGTWFARRVNTGSVFLVGQITAATVDGNQHFFANSTSGLRWFFPKNDGTGTYFEINLQSVAQIPGNIDFAFSLTNFIDLNGNPHLFGLTSAGEYVTVRRTGVVNGNWQWQYENITQSVLNNNPGVGSLPVILEFEPYATRWNQWGLAGITDTGDVVSIWTAPAFNFWTISNLSDETRNLTGGNVQLTGGLATVITRRFDVPVDQQTQWDGINIGGLNANGELYVLWWAAANVNQDPNNLDSGWRISNLTDPQATAPNSSATDLPRFAADRGLSSYFTTWGGINYVGFNSSGQVQIYWWVPGFAGQYISSIVTDTLPTGTLIPVADLNSYSAPNGTISIFGPGPADETIRLWVDPFAPGTSWGVQNLTNIAQRIES